MRHGYHEGPTRRDDGSFRNLTDTAYVDLGKHFPDLARELKSRKPRSRPEVPAGDDIAFARSRADSPDEEAANQEAIEQSSPGRTEPFLVLEEEAPRDVVPQRKQAIADLSEHFRSPGAKYSLRDARFADGVKAALPAIILSAGCACWMR